MFRKNRTASLLLATKSRKRKRNKISWLTLHSHCSCDFVIDWRESRNQAENENHSKAYARNWTISGQRQVIDLMWTMNQKCQITSIFEIVACAAHANNQLLECVLVHAKQSTVHGIIAGVAGVCLFIIWFSTARNWCGICIHSKEAHAPHARYTHRYRRPWRSTVNYKSTNGRPNISIIIHSCGSCEHNRMCYFFFHLSLLFIFWIRIYG